MNLPSTTPNPTRTGISPKYKSLISHENAHSATTEKHKINDILEKEKQNNKIDNWNKLDKMTRINKLHQYADKYVQEHKLSIQELEALKVYLVNCTNQSKLQKSKEVIYNKDTMEIQDIPSLFFHPVNRNFTLRAQDSKRLSTLKSLTPNRGGSAISTSSKIAAKPPLGKIVDDKEETPK